MPYGMAFFFLLKPLLGWIKIVQLREQGHHDINGLAFESLLFLALA